MSGFDFNTDLSNCGASEPFALRVMGDDMLPEFQDGHIIVIDPGGTVKNECYVVANPNNELIFRQLIIEGDRYLLRATQPGFDEIPLPKGIEDIVGVVSQRSGRRRSEHKRYDL